MTLPVDILSCTATLVVPGCDDSHSAIQKRINIKVFSVLTPIANRMMIKVLEFGPK